MQLKLVTGDGEQALDDESMMGLTGLASGCCFAFNKVSEHLFVVGTEEGKIHKCSKAYSGQCVPCILQQNLSHYFALCVQKIYFIFFKGSVFANTEKVCIEVRYRVRGLRSRTKRATA